MFIRNFSVGLSAGQMVVSNILGRIFFLFGSVSVMLLSAVNLFQIPIYGRCVVFVQLFDRRPALIYWLHWILQFATPFGARAEPFSNFGSEKLSKNRPALGRQKMDGS